MQTLKTITLFATVSNSASSRTSKNGRNYTAFGVSILDNDRIRSFHYNVVAFDKQGHFAKPLQKGTRINSSCRHNPSPTTSTASRSSPQPLCGRFVRPAHSRTEARPSNAAPQPS